LHQKKDLEKVEFVHGKGKRKTPLQLAIETLVHLGKEIAFQFKNI